jgi:ParB-like chromosome segregation protein Spo0J
MAASLDMPEVEHVHLSRLRTPPENDAVYGKVDPTDADVQALAVSIRERGILNPLVVTPDGYVMDGNRRLVAARLAGLDTVPVRVKNVSRGDPEFTRLLVESNRQRVKTLDQRFREAIATTSPEDAYRELVEYRRQAATVTVSQIEASASRVRKAIVGNRPIVEAALRVLTAQREYWPLSLRQLHYRLLADPPLIHASKDTRYANDESSYRTLSNVITRARLAGDIPMQALDDETRPFTSWRTWAEPGAFMADGMEQLFRGYSRDLLQSQPCHVEVWAEKLTVQSILKPACAEFTIPLTIGRGFGSLPAKYDLFRRFHRSGRERLVLLLVSDLDPAGVGIPQDMADAFVHDFGVDRARLSVVRVALTIEQVRDLALLPNGKAKPMSAQFKAYCRDYGQNVYELEALAPADLQRLLRDAIVSILDIEALNHEKRQERQDAADLAARRQTLLEVAGSIPGTITP